MLISRITKQIEWVNHNGVSKPMVIELEEHSEYPPVYTPKDFMCVKCLKGYLRQGWPIELHPGAEFKLDTAEIKGDFWVVDNTGLIKSVGAYYVKAFQVGP